jgi:hypothetical protein
LSVIESIIIVRAVNSSQGRYANAAQTQDEQIHPEADLKDTIARIADAHPINRINELMPWCTCP